MTQLSFKIILLGLMFALAQCCQNSPKNEAKIIAQKDSLEAWFIDQSSNDSLYINKMVRFKNKMGLDRKMNIGYHKVVINLAKKKATQKIYDFELLQEIKFLLYQTDSNINIYRTKELNILGSMYLLAPFYDSAVYYFSEAIHYNQRTAREERDFMESYMGMGNTKNQLSQLDLGTSYLRKAQEIAKNLKDTLTTFQLMGDMGRAFMATGLHPDEIAEFKKQIAFYTLHEMYPELILANANTALAYLNRRLLKEALEISISTRQLAKIYNAPPYFQFYVYYALGGALQKNGHAENSIHAFDTAIYFARQIGSTFLEDKIQMVKVFSFVDMNIPAEGDRCLEIVKKHEGLYQHTPIARENFWEFSYIVSKALKNYSKALYFLEKYNELRDSIGIHQKSLAIAELEKKRLIAAEDQLLENKELELKSIKQAQELWVLGGIIIVLMVSFISALIIYIRKNKHLREEYKLKEKFNSDLIIATDNERARIAKDLHDGIGQELTFIRNSFSGPESELLKQLIDSALHHLREHVSNLYPHFLESLGLKDALTSLINQIDSTYHLFISHDIHLKEEVSPQLTLNIYRIVQESFNNIIKHSKAQAAKIEIIEDEMGINLTIKDNGIGFSPNLVAVKSDSGLGLNSIKQRVSLLNGKLQIQSTGLGTQIDIHIPNHE
jgi:signal transduction histidine kinase